VAVRRLWARDPGRVALESLRTEQNVQQAYERYAGELFGFALGVLGDRQLAEDVVQETFVKAWRAGGRFDPERGSLRTWLFAIARNNVADVARRRSTGMPVSTESETEEPGGDPVDRLLTSIQVSAALDRLSPEHRQVVVEVHFHGRSCADLSRQLRLPASTVRSRLYYGVRALRLILEEHGWQA
jgi:RNA polymerase sigma-70 factor (ECF subfamily)